MKPRDEWGPADEMANGIMFGVIIIGCLGLAFALYLVCLWLING